MPLSFARLLCPLLLLLALAPPALAQGAPHIAIRPAAGEAEKAVFDIAITGLLADAPYTVEILFQAEVVFSSDETSNADGEIPFPIRSTEGDQPGVHTIQVVRDGEVVVSAEFELTAAAAEARSELLGDVTVRPESVPFGRAQTIHISELEPQSAYIVTITNSETLQVAYRRSLTSDVDGSIEIEVFAEEGDAPGRHEVTIQDGAGALIAEGRLTIQAPPEREISVNLSPAKASAGEPVDIAVSGAGAFDSVTAQITSADGILIDTVLARATSEGSATLRFVSPEDLAGGAYLVDIFVEGEKRTGATLVIGDGVPDVAAAAVIEPASGPIGSQHTIAVTGLAAEQSFDILILDPAGAEEYRSSRRADADGAFSLTISSTDEDEIGIYSVEIRGDANGELLAAAKFEISAADPPEEPAVEDAPAAEALATINPQSAPIGSSHRITVSRLSANESVTIDVVFRGASVYRTDKIADADGMITFELFTSDDDVPGDYIVNVWRAAGNQPSVTLTATVKTPPASVAGAVGDAQVIDGRLAEGSAEIGFDGARGQYLLLRVLSEDFDPSAALIDRDGKEIAFNDDSRGRKDAIIGPLTLPYSGRYRLKIGAAPLMMAQGAINGEFAAHISRVSVTTIPFDTDLPFSLSAERPALYYALPVEAGESLTVKVDGGGLDTLLQVVSPAGSEFAFDDDSGSGFDAELSNLVFDHSASYILVVATFDDQASGAGTLSVARNPAQSLDAGEATVTLNDKAIRDLVIFDAAEDELLVLNLEKRAGDVEDLYVTATIDGMEIMSYSTMGVPEHLPLAFVTPMAGRVVVTLEKFGFDDGISLGVSLERP